MAKDRIRVRLRGFDIELVEQSAKAIVQDSSEGLVPRSLVPYLSRLVSTNILF